MRLHDTACREAAAFGDLTGFQELQPRGQRRAGHATSATEEAEGGNAPSQAGRIPAEDGVGLTPVQAPPEPGRQFQPRHSRCGCGRPAQDRAGPVELHLNLGTEVEGKAEVVAAALDLVDDVDAARRPVQQHRATMQRRRIKRGVAVMLGSPSGDVAVVDDLDLSGIAHDAPT